MASHINKSLQLSALCVAIACVHTSAWAIESLEKLDDDTLAESTGEGIAFLPENFSMRMNGPDAANSGQGTFGTGYAHIIPVGPLSAASEAKGYSKAEAWLYGVSLAQSKTNYGADITKDDWGVPFGDVKATTTATDFGRPITSWGTAENPWIFKTLTNPSVPDFTGASKSVTYMILEAPLYHTTVPAAGTAESAAYNLKLGMWADFFTRNKTTADDGAYAGYSLPSRLRLAAVWDGFSVNGSNLKIFQTLDGVTNANKGGTYNATLKINDVDTVKTFNYGMGTDYNKTFGMAGLVRLNSRPTDSVRASAVFGNTTREIKQVNYNPATNWNTVTETYAGSYTEGATLATNTVSGNGLGTMTSAVAGGANTNAGVTTTYDPMVNNGYRGAPALVDPATAAQAKAGGYKPSYYYRNGSGGVVRGEFYDGGVCTSSKAGNSSGNNQFGQCLFREGFTTRRFKVSSTNSWTPPEVKSVIRLSTQELSGGTFGTGTPALAGGAGVGNVPNFTPNTNAEGVFLYDANINLILGNLYQPLMLSTDGNNFSIELARIPNVQAIYRKIYQRYTGDTGDAGITYEGSTCNIYQCGAGIGNYQGNTATHSSITIGSTEYNATTNEITAHKGIGAYGVSIGELKSDTGLSSVNQQDFVQVWRTPQRASSFPGFGAYVKAPIAAPITSAPHPSLLRSDPYETIYRQNYNNQILGIQSTMPQTDAAMQSTINNMTPVGKTVSNNFGSVAIDGLLIQHFKFSTTGL